MNVPSSTKQRESRSFAQNVASLEQLTGAAFSPRSKVSGGPIENFRRGWAKSGHRGRLAHYFERGTFDSAISLCGMTVPVRMLFGKGNFDDCCNCVVKKAKHDRRRSSC